LIGLRRRDALPRDVLTALPRLGVKRDQIVAVFGASGHTGRFVVAELRQRGHTPLLVGRDAAKLKAGADAHPGLAMRIASADSPTSLDRALSGAAVVINCAGPYSKL
jgi:short subunit dehydrogenase-like uncharacterized protein